MLAWLRSVAFRIWSRFRRDRLDAELAEELRVHSEFLEDEARRAGKDIDAARQAALRLGNRTAVREAAHDGWSWGVLDRLGRDLRYAARFLRRSPAFTLVAVLSITLGVGANAAVFTIVDRIFLRPPTGLPDPGAVRRLYVHLASTTQPGFTLNVQAWPLYLALDSFPRFERIAGYLYPQATKLGPEWDAPTLQVAPATWDYFGLLGIQPALGRVFTRGDEADDAPLIAVLSHAYWSNRFGGDPGVLGSTIRLNGQVATIVGIAQAGFSGVDLDPADAWVPAAPMLTRGGQFGNSWRRSWSTMSVNVLLRLRTDEPESTIASETTRLIMNERPEGWRDRTMTAEFGSVIRALGPANREAGISVALRLAGAAALVLLVACANLGSLLLARGISRQRELAVRLALGVSRKRLLSQLLAESLLVCAIGAGCALLLAHYGGRFLHALVFPDGAPLAAPVDGRIIAVTLLVTLVFGVIASVLPLVRAVRTDVGHALKSGAQSGPSGHGLRSTLLAVQLAFSLLLLVGAGLFTRSLMRATQFDVGFEARTSVMVLMNVLGGPMAPPAREALLTDATERLQRVDGVRDVARTVGWPFEAIHFDNLSIPERDIAQEVRGQDWFLFPVTGSGMRAFGIRLLRGRLLEDSDTRATSPVVVVSERLARALWPGQDPIGKQLRVGADSMPYREVVGVTQDMTTVELTRTGEGQFFVPPDQIGRTPTYLVVRAEGDVDAVITRVRAALTGWRTDYSSLRVQAIGSAIDKQTRPWRLGAIVFAGFGVLALTLAAIGVFGLVSFIVTQRTREFGIRAALGASRASLARTVLRSALAFASAGLAVGIVGSLGASQWLSSLLFQTSARDVGTIVAASLVLLVATVLAALPPIRRATQADPVTALRSE